jgi:acetyl esterase/lipase
MVAMAAETPRDPTTAEFTPRTAELDLAEAGKSRRRLRRSPAVPAPQVRLGALASGGLAPAIMAIVERGVRRRPALASALNAEIELTLDGEYPPVRIVFGEKLVLVEDGKAVAPDARVEGTLPDLISVMVTPLVGGLPNPIVARGRAALGNVARGRVRFHGRLGLVRRFLAVIRI